MGNTIANVVGSLMVIGLITAAVLPGRQTPQTITAAGQAGSSLLYAAEGLH